MHFAFGRRFHHGNHDSGYTRRIWVPFIYEYIYPRRDPCKELDAGLFRHLIALVVMKIS